MKAHRFAIGLTLVAVAMGAGAGCATTSPEARREADARRARCASIELVPAGVVPSRPYQVLAAVSADAGPRSGNEVLRDDACRLGADAVINIRTESAPELTPSGPGAMFEERAQVSGTAVVWTDETAAASAPASAAEPPTER